MHWYVDVLKNYTGFSGRAHRTEFWMFALINFIIAIVLNTVLGFVGLDALGMLYSLGVLLPSIAVSMRRLHDTGRSGWWLLLIFLIFIGWIPLLIFYCLDSTPGENEYGPNPKEVVA